MRLSAECRQWSGGCPQSDVVTLAMLSRLEKPTDANEIVDLAFVLSQMGI